MPTYPEASFRTALARAVPIDMRIDSPSRMFMVIEAIRTRLGSQLPAILITGHASGAIRELRSKDFLRKASDPINPETLLSLLRELS